MSVAVWSFLKGLYGVGFTLVSRSYYFLRRRSPAPPLPVPARDHRQAGERGGAINAALRSCHLEIAAALSAACTLIS
jgi:hypothetical protein